MKALLWLSLDELRLARCDRLTSNFADPSGNFLVVGGIVIVSLCFSGLRIYKELASAPPVA